MWGAAGQDFSECKRLFNNNQPTAYAGAA